MNDSLGDRMKSYEERTTTHKLLPLIPSMARLDGRSFSSFTRGLDRPYDVRMSNLMVETTKYLVKETAANCGYTQSDEITLAWYNSFEESELFFGGKLQKLASVLAGMCSSYFILHLPAHLPTGYQAKLPHFDCRVWNVPTLMEATNCFLWREWDATKNSVQMAAQTVYSHAELHGKDQIDQQEMLFQKGINWNNYPDFFKRGSYVQRKLVKRKLSAEELKDLPEFHHAKSNPDMLVTRSEYGRLDMPPLSKVSNKIGVLFYEEPVKLCEEK